MVSDINSPSSFSSTSGCEMIQQIFKTIDTNGDGSIDETEISSLIKQATATLIDKIFSKQDADQDNEQNKDQGTLISLIESNSGLAKLGQEMKSGDGILALSGALYPLENDFASSDKNKDGFLGRDELLAVKKKSVDIDKLFNKVDTDRNGLISRTEDETYRKQIMAQTEPSEFPNSGIKDSHSFDQNWLIGIFEALLKSLATASVASNQSTSIHV